MPDVLYDCMHYALHHTKLPQYMREMKKYHLAHHYKNFELGFGVTSKYFLSAPVSGVCYPDPSRSRSPSGSTTALSPSSSHV